MGILLPAPFVEPSASQCGTGGCCRLTPHTSPCRSLQAWQRTQLCNTLLWRKALLSPGCFHWEQGMRSAELLWFYCQDIGIAKEQSKGQAASEELFVISITSLSYLFPSTMLKYLKGGKFLLPPFHIFKKSTICLKALINFHKYLRPVLALKFIKVNLEWADFRGAAPASLRADLPSLCPVQ